MKNKAIISFFFLLIVQVGVIKGDEPKDVLDQCLATFKHPFSMFFFQKLKRHEHKDLKKDTAFNMIYTIEKFDALKEQIDSADKDTLLILDVDYTLTQPSNPAFQQANFCLNPQMVKNFIKSVPDSLKSEFTSFIATSGEGQLLEEEAPSMIRTVKEKGARVLVISGILTGQWQDIPIQKKN